MSRRGFDSQRHLNEGSGLLGSDLQGRLEICPPVSRTLILSFSQNGRRDTSRTDGGIGMRRCRMYADAALVMAVVC